MISADVANRLQPAADLALRPAAPAQDISDKLAGLVAGQRLLAEIQSLLPNGSYRALINQRSVTLGLPFAATPGDTIELEVTESDGKLTLAVLSKALAESDGDAAASTRLSRTGQLIGALLAARSAESVALPLNDNQPISERPPTDAKELLPLLRQAISESGMFYESHQAEWIEGRYPQRQLLQEPQGRLTPHTAVPQATSSGNLPAASDAVQVSPALAPLVPTTPPAQLAAAVAPELQTVVQQQLEAFATQTFAWQGQIWAGQQMQWEIDDARDGRASGGDDSPRWQTRLRLTLPRLGAVEARLLIEGKQLKLSVLADHGETRALLHADADRLRRQLEQAGLDLASMGIAAPAGSQPPPA